LTAAAVIASSLAVGLTLLVTILEVDAPRMLTITIASSQSQRGACFLERLGLAAPRVGSLVATERSQSKYECE
jgi:hypothetical protein